MKTRISWIRTVLAACVLLLPACGKNSDTKEAHNHSEHEEGEEGGGEVAFKEGRGLTLNPEVIRALGLKTEEASERPLSAEVRLMAQVFSVSPGVLASARSPSSQVGFFEQRTFTGAKLVRIDRSTESATRLVDLVFSIESTPAPAMGDFIDLKLASEPVSALAVPRSAILDSATGTFVYVVNGEFFIRTPVKVGMRSGDFTEITDGLYTGDVVVVTPVNQLWLAELRLTKGGGHSH